MENTQPQKEKSGEKPKNKERKLKMKKESKTDEEKANPDNPKNNDIANPVELNPKNVSSAFSKADKKCNDKEKPKDKGKRRSRHEEEGRDFKCECGKAYLSETALTNHKIQKHDFHTEKRGKGRPRKNPLDTQKGLELQQLKYKQFFDNILRKPNDKEPDIDACFLEIFSNLKNTNYKHFVAEKNQIYLNLKRHDFYNHTEKPTVDEAFCLYLREFMQKTNPDYFKFMILFCLLFRESFVSSHKNLLEDTENTLTPLELPNHCNDFITFYMEPNDFFKIHHVEEIFNIIPHFCYWLYSRGFTTYRITLNNNPDRQ